MARKNKAKKMQVTVTTGNPQGFPSGNAPSERVIIQTPSSINPNQKKRNRRNKNGKNRGPRKIQSARNQYGRERSYFLSALLAPSLMGPIRQPRAGGSTRTGLGYDQTEVIITGSATNTVQGVAAGTVYTTSACSQLAVANESTGLYSSATAISVATQFPSSTQIADVNLVACDLVAYYTGNPLNVQGEILMGASIPISSTATYASLYYYPGFQKFPVAQLIQKPMRVCMRKLSPVADEFVGGTQGNADVDVPIILASGLPTGGTLKILCTRSWEYRSSTSPALVIPYEKVGENHSGDLAAYQDARADLGAMDSPITEALPEMAQSSTGLTTLLGLSGAVGTSAYAVLNAGRNIMNRQRNVGPRLYEADEHMTAFQEYAALLARSQQ